MAEIVLDDVQSSLFTSASGPVQVCDTAGQVLGQLVPNGEKYGARSDSYDKDHWVQCWHEWHFGTADDE